jgi:hypothetical protein
MRDQSTYNLGHSEKGSGWLVRTKSPVVALTTKQLVYRSLPGFCLAS